jgi:hypothetical protein
MSTHELIHQERALTDVLDSQVLKSVADPANAFGHEATMEDLVVRSGIRAGIADNLSADLEAWWSNLSSQLP